MGNVTELRVALTVEDFDGAVAFYRDALGLEQIADWSSATGRVVVLEAGRATLELFDHAQAESVDAIEAGLHFAIEAENRINRHRCWTSRQSGAVGHSCCRIATLPRGSCLEDRQPRVDLSFLV